MSETLKPTSGEMGGEVKPLSLRRPKTVEEWRQLYRILIGKDVLRLVNYKVPEDGDKLLTFEQFLEMFQDVSLYGLTQQDLKEIEAVRRRIESEQE